MLTELLNDPKYNKNLKKLLMCLLGSSDTVTAESMCQRNKLCTKAISLVPLHGQKGLIYIILQKTFSNGEQTMFLHSFPKKLSMVLFT